MAPLRWLALTLCMVVVAPACVSSRGPSGASPQELRDMINLCDQFVRAPEVVDPAPIVQFMNESPEVVVVLGPHLEGVAVGDDVPKWASTLLLSGYIAGNVRTQLVNGRKQDEPVAGFRGALSVYQVLQAKGLSMETIDAIAEAEREGTLDSWVAARMRASDTEA